MVFANNTLAGRYQIVKYLSQGGMGAVYLGHDSQTDTPVAIKHLKPDVVEADPTLLARFEREGEALRALNHPNIVKVLDTLQENDQHFLIMEYVGGGSLTDLLAKQPQLPIPLVVQIALDLTDALTRSHRLKIIHRDIKPANVLLAEDGTPRLTDFGVAHVGDSTLSSDGVVLGTCAYLSPEALLGQQLDTRADIWAFGVMLFEMLAGRRPFEEVNYASLINAIVNKPIPDLEALRPDAPVALVDLVYRMLAKDREQRINSVRQVGIELEAILHGGTFTHLADPSFVIETKAAQIDDVKTVFSSTPTPSKPQQTPDNLPQQTTPFVGRTTELAELTRMITSTESRLLTVLAPGGMGKTRLALEVAAAQLDQFEDGVFYVALAPLDAPDQVLTETAQAINFTFQKNAPQQEQLINYLHDKKMLLIFDNLEHLPAASSLISEILQGTHAVKVIVTSRERLNLQAENLFWLGGLDYPDNDTVAIVQGLERYGAVQLFVQSARRTRHDFSITEDSLSDVLRIVRLMQGMPLGIVLAAAWAEMLSIREIADEIENNLDFLTSEQDDLPERQRSLRAVFEYSWDLLSEPEQDAFKKLSVFHGHFTREAAQNVVDASLKTLMGLVNKSLLHRDPSLGLYQVDPMLRQYAEAQLADAERAVLRDNHRAYYLALIRQQVSQLQGRGREQALQTIRQEDANIVSAWEWAINQQHLEEIVDTYEEMLVYNLIQFQPQTMLRQLAQIIDALKDVPHEGKLGVAYATASALHAGLQTISGTDLTPAQRHQLEAAKTLLTKLDARHELALLSNIGVVLGGFEEASTALKNALASFREFGDKGGLGQVVASSWAAIKKRTRH